MTKLVFSFMHASDELKEDITRFYVRAVNRTKELFGKAAVPETPIAQRTWIILQDQPLRSIESIFNAVVVGGFAVVRRPEDTMETIQFRVKTSLINSIADAFKTSIDFEMGLFPEDISTSHSRRSDLIPRRDDPDDSKLTYRKLIAKEELESWWDDMLQVIEETVDRLLVWLDDYLSKLLTLPDDVTYDTCNSGVEEDYFKIYVPYRF